MVLNWKNIHGNFTNWKNIDGNFTKWKNKFYVVIAFTFCSSLVASAKVYILWMCHCGCLKLYSISIMDIGKHNDKMHYAGVRQRAMQYHTTQCNTMQYHGIKWNIMHNLIIISEVSILTQFSIKSQECISWYHSEMKVEKNTGTIKYIFLQGGEDSSMCGCIHVFNFNHCNCNWQVNLK